MSDRLDFFRLKPGSMVQLLNSTPRGAVINDRKLKAIRNEAGGQVGFTKLNFFKTVAWLVEQRHNPRDPNAAPNDDGATYEAKKRRERERAAKLSRAGRDIAPIPAVVDAVRRESCRLSLRLFCETYFAERFLLEWSHDQLRLIATLEAIILNGGTHAFALPRASGKTTICEVATLWAMMYGHRRFVVLVGATKDAADEMRESILVELEGNDFLLDDFPEVCYPIRCIDGIYNRGKGQLCDGERTRVSLSGEKIILPSIKGSVASSAILAIVGITGRIRGMKFTRPDRTSVRPDLAIVDDPQTNESATSPGQTRKRLKVILGAVLGLAGPGKKIAAGIPVTVIEYGDLADQLLDHKLHPEMRGVRCRMVNAWPKDDDSLKALDEYADRRRRELSGGGDGHEATTWYVEHQEVIERGGEASWPARFEPGEVSALQHAFNLRIDRALIFESEYQNNPPRPDEDKLRIVPPQGDIQARLSKRPRFEMPLFTDRVVCMIDVQQDVLFYMVAAFNELFTGSIIDWGTYPDQARNYFTLNDLHRTLRSARPGANIDGAIYAGLEALTTKLTENVYRREDGVPFKISKLLIDAGYKSHLVYQVCREPHVLPLGLPSFGRAFGPTQRPLSAFEKKPGDQVGLNWHVTRSVKRAARHVISDVNFWKSFLFDRFNAAIGDIGALTLFGTDAHQHFMLGEHLTSEYPSLVESKTHGRTVTAWDLRPGRENHGLDLAVGCMVAASMSGCTLPTLQGEHGPKTGRRKITRADVPPRRRRA